MRRTREGRRAIVRLVRALVVAGLLTGVLATLGATASGAQAATCTANQKSTLCNPWGSGVNLRRTPNASGDAVWLPYGTGLFINCWQTGQSINGPWGTSDIWDFVSWTSQYGYGWTGYVSDTYVYTGTNGPPDWVGRCPPGLEGNV